MWKLQLTLRRTVSEETGGGLVTKLCLTLANPMSMGFSRQESLGIKSSLPTPEGL